MMRKPCPGTLGLGCLVWIPLDRELCHYCRRTRAMVRRAA